MCYAHDLTLEDPFDEEQVLPGLIREVRRTLPHVDIEFAPDTDWFVRNVQAIAELAPLIRLDLVHFVSRGGSVVPMFSNDAEEGGFVESLGLFNETLRLVDAVRLRRLTKLALPNADGLELRRMGEIREHRTFERFRARERAALGAVATAAVDDEKIQANFREEMRAAAAEINIASSPWRLGRGLTPRLIGWGVGTLTAGLIDWHAAVAILAAGAATKAAELVSASAAQTLAERTTGTRALHHHFATLGRPVDTRNA